MRAHPDIFELKKVRLDLQGFCIVLLESRLVGAKNLRVGQTPQAKHQERKYPGVDFP